MTISGEGESVFPEPGSATGTPFGGGIAMSFAQSARRLTSSRLSTQLAVFLLRLANPLLRREGKRNSNDLN